ncbi:MAG: LicD family protein [Clostridia bacterium]|nr:LicD family protein [Clostridia bacterium]
MSGADTKTKAIINYIIPYPYSKVGSYEEKYNLKEAHEDMMRLLLSFDRFCKEHDLKYSLADGTLLGAMRHGDFVPWDDDADVMMTRTEYTKLRQVLAEDSEIKVLKIHFLDRVTTKELLEKKIYIDLFINEEKPANELVFKWKKFKTGFLRTAFHNTKVRNVRHDKYNKTYKKIRDIVSSILGLFAKIIVGPRDIFELNDKAVAIKKHKPSGIYTRYTSRMYETGRRFNKKSYDEGYGEVLFRGEKLMALINSDTFLKEMYGDYSLLPSEERRKPEHPVNMLDSPKKCIKFFN